MHNKMLNENTNNKLTPESVFRLLDVNAIVDAESKYRKK
ncbi:hypothetical protein JBKA6_0192 [Ichthyobacterium seriolicida]|uniref:Uncharacterized protein n=1 Tax=Ichthyobacterium seriolicida TaxID=242600 RepID=A0A1J1DZU9_9FLAO|nr:hypothetical protein JBKA6_0192 [Ichthyobacterium seriolicida]